MELGDFKGKRGRPVVKYSDSVSCAKTAEPIEMLFGIWTRVGLGNHVLCGGAHWRHLENTTEPSTCGSDAACCQITFTTCLILSPFPMQSQTL